MLTLLAASACQDSASASGTALYVTAEFDPPLQLTQLQVSGDVEGDGGTITPTLLPDTPERLLHSGETFRVLLPDAPDGAWATLRVEGRLSARPAAEGTARVRVHAGREVDVTVWLEPTNSGTSSCTHDCEGCCQEGRCVSTAFTRCGANGGACEACDPDRASACAPEGFCACGTGSACTRPEVDRCVAGECRCGTGPACGPNEKCLNGRCWCGDGNACGLGQVCQGGECRCGDGNACDVGQACINGRCGCTADSCASGCCSGDKCMSGTTQNQCGKGGAACQQCRKECTADRVCK
ncbi:hypothetical protein JY651_36555 [Pyxidicoccus parkwayensis]|uniref:Lipoprotein n=1 Tax=Pyxidicoccus parkwayensis TaxID=2813578 RepID=A0ABX7PDC9_9BACT|nr:hypothetical protein JY651_36555 [Pyxidicoccus parkwaysis]